MKRISLLFLLFTIVSCANIDIHKASNDSESGLRFYRPYPYLWITLNDKGACIPQTVYLPNMKEEYVIVPKPGLGTVAFKPTLQDGWNLTNFDGNIDTKTNENIKAIGDFIGSVAPIAGLGKPFAPGAQESTNKLSPGLYAIKFGDDGLISGFKPISVFVDKDGNQIPCSAPTPDKSK